jgi:hypothetical protein
MTFCSKHNHIQFNRQNNIDDKQQHKLEKLSSTTNGSIDLRNLIQHHIHLFTVAGSVLVLNWILLQIYGF